ncbi:MAG: NADH-quinone oxidoreductase subunit L [Phycisphaerales bacterium]|nr:MAG: NADH-quinone oxidoreductase subunit L [Phycisphaerales bacterium]
MTMAGVLTESTTAVLPDQGALGAILALADGPFIPGGSAPGWLVLMPLLPLIGAALCVLFAALNIKTKLPGYATVVLLAGAFATAVAAFIGGDDGDSFGVATIFRWIHAGLDAGGDGRLTANFAFYMDGLSMLWMLFVTGLATVIGLYSTEYVEHDRGLGYCRYFFAFNLFVFSMSCLVMADNLLLLFLGWEGVGLCSYLLIGYYYKKPQAVAAAKKAFIMNRIGDVGLLMAIGATLVVFGTLEFRPLFEMIAHGVDGQGRPLAGSWIVVVIPLLLTAGAFGKSAQLFLYTWLPDAMEGPTPVSALIHAATMVTAGVYLVARTYPLYTADEHLIALSVIAWSGAITAFWAAAIAFAQYDIKRIMGYSTISQLGYMFAGLGVLTTTGAVFHVLTHAFFKATLFLCCGAVMHGFAGQLDMRRLSGLWSIPGFRLTALAMLVGCLNLAGLAGTAGYFSKDMILAEAFVTPASLITLPWAVGLVLLLTALMTAYYTFRVFFRVFVGPVHYEPGPDLHGHDDHHHDGHDGHDGDHHGRSGFHPHAPRLAMNTAMAVLALGSVAATALYFVPSGHHGWAGAMVHQSSAAYTPPVVVHHGPEHAGLGAGRIEPGHHPTEPTVGGATGGGNHGDNLGLGLDPHKAMYLVSGVIAVLGIALAAFFHGPRGVAGLWLGNRRDTSSPRMDALAARMGPLPRLAERKFLVDELYDRVIVRPLLVFSHLFHAFDKLVIDGLVDLAGALPRWLGLLLRPSQNGLLHGYATGMVAGTAALVALIVLAALL